MWEVTIMQPNRCSEADWRVYREVSGRAIDRYCERALSEVARVLADEPMGAWDRLAAIESVSREHRRILRRDFSTMSRSSARTQLYAMNAAGLLEPEDRARFSDEMRTVFDPLP
jgi:hypothetical protein